MLNLVLNHLRSILKIDVEVRDVAVSLEGISCYIDTYGGVSERAIVILSFDKPENHVRCIATLKTSNAFVGEWLVQGTTCDLSAAWLSVMANRTGCGDYWLDTPSEVV
jgi:hypothetical protein